MDPPAPGNLPLPSLSAKRGKRKAGSVPVFFFKRGHSSRGNGNKLFPTIAYQLSLLGAELKKAISLRVEDNPSILSRSLAGQLRQLIVEPCQESITPHTLVIVIDGLDECEGNNIQQEILQFIGDAVQQLRLIHIFVASRAESHIRDIFSSSGMASCHRSMNIQESFDDVRIYLEDEFTRIQQQHKETMAAVQTPWPSPKDIDKLVKKLSGYSIYASTIIKFIDDKDFRPNERLDLVMGIAVSESTKDESPFWALDQLYMQIISQTPPAARRRPVTTTTTTMGSKCLF
ncbi:hypothetical protein B0H13DRAFT_1930932 [Mycena leptocephala]|nr:hypothetical protein B0H13DRAFT_1930932 [Mycena leptocephala]